MQLIKIWYEGFGLFDSVKDYTLLVKITVQLNTTSYAKCNTELCCENTETGAWRSELLNLRSPWLRMCRFCISRWVPPWDDKETKELLSKILKILKADWQSAAYTKDNPTTTRTGSHVNLSWLRCGPRPQKQSQLVSVTLTGKLATPYTFQLSWCWLMGTSHLVSLSHTGLSYLMTSCIMD